ncbi:Protein CBG25315 [Caenorhabditis briggsae]|uniref:Protein CBG25315 n=1 Tax=Caenorhabditis briggsae TaxID=6238 RepID=B6IH13_CAEBR|nr:Protein CBG25315 [Caenorhabditis briggsae]CAR99193.1 Protein CBG25315 [Caenorhabditis briggsae]
MYPTSINKGVNLVTNSRMGYCSTNKPLRYREVFSKVSSIRKPLPQLTSVYNSSCSPRNDTKSFSLQKPLSVPFLSHKDIRIQVRSE